MEKRVPVSENRPDHREDCWMAATMAGSMNPALRASVLGRSAFTQA
jgi:hypothetical protein